MKRCRSTNGKRKMFSNMDSMPVMTIEIGISAGRVLSKSAAKRPLSASSTCLRNSKGARFGMVRLILSLDQ